MNLRPSGYEPDELPDCSTPHQEGRAFYKRILRAAIPQAPPPYRHGTGADRRPPGMTAERAGVPGQGGEQWRAALGEAQEIAAAIFLARAAAASRSRPRAGQPIPSPSRGLGFGMM